MSSSKTESIEVFCDHLGFTVKGEVLYLKYAVLGTNPLASAQDIRCSFRDECNRNLDECPLFLKGKLNTKW